MTFLSVAERLGDIHTAALFGMVAGLIFGVSAQRSSFCLRAATVEFARGQLGPRMSVWLLTFSTAVVWVQGATLLGWMDPSEARLMAIPGTWSGAIIGGLLFGVGMVLARGCSGRLLVLAATGNLRSVVSGLVFAVVAQMSMAGWLSPLRDRLTGLWTTQGGHNINLLQALHLPEYSGLAFGLILAAGAIWLSVRNQIPILRLIFSSGVGFAVAVAWVLTFGLAQVSFEPFQVQGATFTGPSANTLMFFMKRDAVFDFDIGLIAGVFLGSFLAAVLSREFAFQAFTDADNMKRSILGASFMGFGGMLAGGCAIGAGVTGGSIFVATAWVALTSMWVGAVLADLMVDQKKCCFWSNARA